MSRKTATAEKQPDLLGGQTQTKPKQDDVAKVAVSKGQVAKVDPKKPTASNVTKLEPKTLIDRLREISDKKDVELAREILAMIRDEEDRIAERAFNAAMLETQKQIGAAPPIKRKSFNRHTRSFWAKLEDISRQVDPLIHKNGFTISYGGAASRLPDHYCVIADVCHSAGHRRRYEMDVGMDHKGPKGEGTKSLAQGSGSSVTYARRFLKCMIFDVQIEGMDNDGNGADPQRPTVIDAEPGEAVALITDKQAETLVELIEAKGRTRAAFCKAWQIDKVVNLPAADYETAVDKLKALRNA